jgi:hypothetical protein
MSTGQRDRLCDRASAEVRLILCCARVDLDPKTRGDIEHLLASPLNWDIVLDVATAHGLLPLVYWHLRKYFGSSAVTLCGQTNTFTRASTSASDQSLVPYLVAQRLRSDFNAGAAGNFLLATELVRICECLAAHGIHVLCYKGPSLAVVCYGNLLLRPFHDLDVLLQKQDVARAEQVLVSLGYCRKPHSDRESNEYAHTFSRSPNHACKSYAAGTDLSGNVSPGGVGPDGVSSSSAGDIVVELHWSIAPGHYAVPLQLKSICNHKMWVDMCGTQLPTSAPEELLLLLCWHGYKHRWGRVEWISAIAELIRPDRDYAGKHLDWARLLRCARKQGSCRVLFLGLWMAHYLLGAQLDSTVIAAMKRDRVAHAIALSVYRDLLHHLNSRHSLGNDSQQVKAILFYHLNMRERLHDKVRYIIQLMLTPHQLNDGAVRNLLQRLLPHRHFRKTSVAKAHPHKG